MQQNTKDLIAQQVVGKMIMDPDFIKEFDRDPDKILNSVSKKISPKDPIKKGDVDEIRTTIKKKISPVPFLTQEEVKALVDDLTKKTNEGYNRVMAMTKVLFAFGMVAIIALFILDLYGIYAEWDWENYVAANGVFGSIGVGSIWSSTQQLPQKVKNSVADLVQIKTALYGYLDQLSIYMQIEQLNPKTKIEFAEKIDLATENTMQRIQRYCTSAQFEKETVRK